jgi:ribonuclease D
MFGDTPLTIIEDTEALKVTIDKLVTFPVVGVDIEADSFHHYQERVCLIQVSVIGADYIIDPLKVEDCSELKRLFDNPEQVLILHGGDYDVVSMKRDYGVTFNNIFDTMLASLFLGIPRIGLADLIGRYFGHHIDKRYQRHDWSKRPLLPEHLHYARGDTHFLLALYEVLERKLRRSGTYDAFREECDLLAEREWSGRNKDPGDFFRVKRSGTLDATGKRVLRALWEYRDQRAQALDRPSFKVLSDNIMIELSEKRPESDSQLHNIIRPTSNLARRHGEALLLHIANGINDERPLPKKPRSASRGSRSRHAPSIDCLYGPLKQWRNNIVNTKKLNPVVVISNQQLKDIARIAPTSLAELGDIPGVRRWQVQRYGKAVLRVIQDTPTPQKPSRKKRSRRRA